MRKLNLLKVFVCLTGVLGIDCGLAFAGEYQTALVQAADGVVSNQITSGVSKGAWVGETDFTGTMLAGMVSAYEATGNAQYLSSAVQAGNYIRSFSSSGLYGDEVYGLALLGSVQADPLNNLWTETAADYFTFIKNGTGGTAGYLDSYYYEAAPSNAVYYVAHLTVAAYKVNAADKALYRDALIKNLSRVDDTSKYPVLSLQVATWAFAQTGELDSTAFPTSTGKMMWRGKTLADLPAMLLSHQVTDGVVVGGQLTHDFDGSFFWRFDHTGGVSAAYGYTEEIVYGVLALSAMQELNPAADYVDEIAAARTLLPVCVFETENGKGEVWNSPWFGDTVMNYYAAELLQAMSELKIGGDINDDGCVDLIDFGRLASKWLVNGCVSESWCNGADINMDSHVNMADFELMAKNWLVCYSMNN